MRAVLVTLLVVLGATMVPTPAQAVTKPVVQSVSPASGTTDGGTTVTIKGERLSHVRKVLFGSAAGTSVQVKSAGKLTVRTPKHAPGTVEVRVETSAGESAKTSTDQYKYKLIWTAREAPRPAHAAANPNLSMGSVACGSAGSCVAVGGYTDSATHHQGLLERLAAGRWEASKAPLPGTPSSDPGAYLNSVACPTSTTCVAVGIYADKNGNTDGLIETFSHGTWTAKKAPQPTGVNSTSTQLTAVACHGTDSCAAVGTYSASTQTSDFEGLLESLGHGTWRATKAPLPGDAVSGQNLQMGGVVCPAAGSCSAVGVYDNPEQVGLVETLSNGGWQGQRADLPGGAHKPFQSVSLPSVACASATRCTAVGQYLDNAQRNEGLIETLPVRATSGAEAAVPGDGNHTTPFVALGALSCVRSACVSIGSYLDNHSAPAGLIEPLSGPGGTTRAPLPAASAVEPDLESIDCPAAGSCTTVGSYVDGQGDAQGLIDDQSGAQWHATKAPVPGNEVAFPAYPILSAVSCPTAISCVAIGQYLEGSHDHIQGLIEQE